MFGIRQRYAFQCACVHYVDIPMLKAHLLFTSSVTHPNASSVQHVVFSARYIIPRCICIIVNYIARYPTWEPNMKVLGGNRSMLGKSSSLCAPLSRILEIVCSNPELSMSTVACFGQFLESTCNKRERLPSRYFHEVSKCNSKFASYF